MDYDWDLILNPVRMRILIALVQQPSTAQQLGEQLRDVPQATLYRHINRLAEGQVIEVAEERPVRGTTEKVYRLQGGGLHLTAEDMAKLSKEDHMRLFLHFAVTLLDDYNRYLQRAEPVDLQADRVGYHKHLFFLSDEEFDQMAAELSKALTPFATHRPDATRRARLVSMVIMPNADSMESTDGNRERKSK